MNAFEIVRERILHGEYDQVLSNSVEIETLTTRLSSSPLSNMSRRNIAALLAELYDQTSDYERAAKLIAFDQEASEARKSLQRAVLFESDRLANDRNNLAASGRGTRSSGQSLTQKSPDIRKNQPAYRSMAMFCLAHSISLHRRTDDKGDSLKRAVELADETLKNLRLLELAGFHIEGAQSFVAYWIGRFYMLQGRIPEADAMFNKSVYYQKANLDFHFSEHQMRCAPHAGDPPRACKACQSKVALSTYQLASSMAFGQAIIKMKAGQISESLMLLRPALVLLEGSRGDRYRKGHATLLTGTAHRILGGADWKVMNRAIGILERSKELFGAEPQSSAAHRYYAARANYELILARLFLVKDKRATVVRRRVEMLQAVKDFCLLAEPEILGEGKVVKEWYADLDLRVRTRLLGCRILCDIIRLAGDISDQDIHSLVPSKLAEVKFLDRLSPTLRSLSRTNKTSSAMRTLSGVLEDAQSQINGAKTTSKRLQGRENHRQAIILAEADLAFVMHENAKLLLGQDDTSDRVCLIDLKQRAQVKLAKAEEGLNELLNEFSNKGNGRTQPNGAKSRATIHIAYARALFLANKLPDAREQLDRGKEFLSWGVENKILFYDAQELQERMPKPKNEVRLPLLRNGVAITKKDLEIALHAKLAQAANEEGLTQQETAERHNVDVKTIKNWCSKGRYVWR